MKKLFFTLSFIILFSSISFGYHKEIVVNNNIELTQKLGYPVITAKNTSDQEIYVEYNFYKYPEDEFLGDVHSSVTLKPNETKNIHFKDLSFLANTEEIRNVLFSWSVENVRKPKQITIETIPFYKSNITQEQLG